VDIAESLRGQELKLTFGSWLDNVLPADYVQRRSEYRFDRELRSRYQREAFDAGWLLPDWPEGLGGRGLDRAESLTIRLEAARRGVPKLNCIQAVGVAAPSIREYGTEAQRSEYLVRTLRGDWWWALGMSEPNAGSDLAGLQTRADLRGDHYVVNGQKTWTTQAHEARWCLLFVRTDASVPKHKGLSCLILDLWSPGVTVRPLEMATDTDEVFCEVFLDEVKVPVQNLLGNVGDGWKVAVGSLNYERDMIWIMNAVEIQRGLAIAAAGMAGRHDPAFEVEIGRRFSDAQAILYTGYRTVTNEIEGRPTPEFSIQKLLGSESLQRTWELAAVVSSPESLCDPEMIYDQLDALAATMYGGTSEIQREIIAERILGLPREPDVDKNVPFRELRLSGSF
jgi:alkylation response protein AidB-like acyl-CoA dehydrogenase